jgi:hypothetical protein
MRVNLAFAGIVLSAQRVATEIPTNCIFMANQSLPYNGCVTGACPIKQVSSKEGCCNLCTRVASCGSFEWNEENNCYLKLAQPKYTPYLPNLKAGVTYSGARAGCPSGFAIIDGSAVAASGFSSINGRGGGEALASCDDCAQLCRLERTCNSFECSPSTHNCSLSNKTYPSAAWATHAADGNSTYVPLHMYLDYQNCVRLWPRFFSDGVERSLAKSQLRCQSVGANIASIHSKHEADHALGASITLGTQEIFPDRWQRSHIGAVRLGGDDTWSWLDESPWDYEYPVSDMRNHSQNAAVQQQGSLLFGELLVRNWARSDANERAPSICRFGPFLSEATDCAAIHNKKQCLSSATAPTAHIDSIFISNKPCAWCCGLECFNGSNSSATKSKQVCAPSFYMQSLPKAAGGHAGWIGHAMDSTGYNTCPSPPAPTAMPTQEQPTRPTPSPPGTKVAAVVVVVAVGRRQQ